MLYIFSKSLSREKFYPDVDFVEGNGLQDLKLVALHVEAEVVDPRIPNRLQGRKERHALDPGLFVPSLVFEATFRIVNYPFG